MTAEGPAAPLYWRVEQERARLGWSATELAERSGVDRSTVYRMRTSKRPPLPATVLDLARVLDIDRDEALQLAGLFNKRTPAKQTVLERHPGEWTYDAEVGAAYVFLDGPIPSGGVATTVPVNAMVNLDYDKGGRVIGIEIIAQWPDASALPKEDE